MKLLNYIKSFFRKKQNKISNFQLKKLYDDFKMKEKKYYKYKQLYEITKSKPIQEKMIEWEIKTSYAGSKFIELQKAIKTG